MNALQKRSHTVSVKPAEVCPAGSRLPTTLDLSGAQGHQQVSLRIDIQQLLLFQTRGVHDIWFRQDRPKEVIVSSSLPLKRIRMKKVRMAEPVTVMNAC